ncbi:hypothetical protein Q8A73_007248 [Channa argus]|nr:hypothetical protein Q8A73_007248 [Channa argus]
MNLHNSLTQRQLEVKVYQPAVPAAGSGSPHGARRRSHTTCFLQEGRRASRKLLDTNNGSGKDSDSVTDRAEDSRVSSLSTGCGPPGWYHDQHVLTFQSEAQGLKL